MGTIKDRNGVGLTEKQKILIRGGKNTQKNCTKKNLHDPDSHDGVIIHRARHPGMGNQVGLRKHHNE